MPNTFEEGFARLQATTGLLELKGHLVVDQHYALDQHERMDYEHPRGGGPKFLSEPFLAEAPAAIQAIAATILHDGGEDAMISYLESVSQRLDPAAPIDEDPNHIRLRRSGQPIVESDGRTVYHRPPDDPREPYLDPEDEMEAIESVSKGYTASY
jgi:hypothetical protein